MTPTAEDLDEWERLAGEASTLPLVLQDTPCGYQLISPPKPDDPFGTTIAEELGEYDALFFVAAREAVPALVAEVRRLRRELDAILECESPKDMYDEAKEALRKT